jgi:DNA-directed RNA polymerase specialized sigma24 family protein
MREVATFKSGVRREAVWKRRGRREGLEKLSEHLPMPTSPAPASKRMALEAIREVVAEQYDQLLFYVRRQIARAVSEGLIPENSVDPEAVADEVSRQALARPQRRPKEATDRLWLYSLARRELETRIQDLRTHSRTDVRLDAASEFSGSVLTNVDLDAEDQNIGGKVTDVQRGKSSLSLIDAHILPPDLAASEHDLIEYLHHASRLWQPAERSVFELHFLEGFELDEVAMLEGQTAAQVEETLKTVQRRLRELLTEAVQTTVSARAKGSRRL